MQIGRLKPWNYDFGLLAHSSASQLFPQQSNNLAHDLQCLSVISGARGTQFVPGLCL